MKVLQVTLFVLLLASLIPQDQLKRVQKAPVAKLYKQICREYRRQGYLVSRERTLKPLRCRCSLMCLEGYMLETNGMLAVTMSLQQAQFVYLDCLQVCKNQEYKRQHKLNNVTMV